MKINSFNDIITLSGKKLSDEQLSVVNSDVATVVSAGAGSGKTTVLSLRFARLVYEKKSSSDRILTLTFTRKAGAEMYERIHRLLSKVASEEGGLSVKADLENNFAKAQISTMDSFWSEIARSGALKYGVSRDFKLETADDSHSLIARLIEQISNDESDGYKYLSSHLTPENLKALFYNVASKVNILTEYSADSIKAQYSELMTLRGKYFLSGKLDSILAELEGLWDGEDPKRSIYGGALQDAISLFDKKRYLAMGNLNKYKPAGMSREDEVILKDLIDQYRETLSQYKLAELSILHEDIEDKIADLLEIFIKKLQSERRRSGVLSFSDIEALAKRVLIDDKAIRNYYKSRFDYIMVDEFQDNNEDQKEILYLISESKESNVDGIPKAKDLDKTKLFFVGDDKQSIYRFRGSDVSVFNALTDEVVKDMGGKALTLSANYRSDKALVDHFNSVFECVFEEDEIKEQEELEELLLSEFRGKRPGSYFAKAKGINSGKGCGSIPSVIEMDIMPKLLNSEDKMEFIDDEDSEAEFIARKIEEIVSDDRFLIPTGHPKFDDIAILFSKTKAQMRIEKALRRHNIPYTVVESTSVTLEGMASDFYSFLQLLVYPEDKKAFLTLMRSPFVRLSNVGLIEFSQSDGDKFIAFSASPKFKNFEDQVAYDNISNFYSNIKKKAEVALISELFEDLYYKSGYYTYINSSNKLAVYGEHFNYLWSFANKADVSGLNLPLFLDSLRELLGEAEKLEGITIQPLAPKGVQLMTIHKSKGLEFPVVILADANAQETNGDADNNIVSSNGEEYFLLYDISQDSDIMRDNGYKDEAKRPIASLFNNYEWRRVKAEKKRILYVALTRAINHIVITGRESKDVFSLYQIYNAALANSGETIKLNEIERYREEELDDIYKSSKEVLYNKSWYENGIAVKKWEYKDHTIGVKEANALEEEASMNLKSNLLPLLSVDTILALHPEVVPDFGTLVHSALEAKLNNISPTHYINRNLTSNEIEALEECAKDISNDFINSNYYKEFVEGREIETEVKFYYPGEDDVVQIGSADLLVKDKEYNLVIDYKTDKSKNPEIHIGQLKAYAKALEELYHKPCYARLCYIRDFSSGPLWDKEGNAL